MDKNTMKNFWYIVMSCTIISTYCVFAMHGKKVHLAAHVNCSVDRNLKIVTEQLISHAKEERKKNKSCLRSNQKKRLAPQRIDRTYNLMFTEK